MVLARCCHLLSTRYSWPVASIVGQAPLKVSLLRDYNIERSLKSTTSPFFLGSFVIFPPTPVLLSCLWSLLVRLTGLDPTVPTLSPTIPTSALFSPLTSPPLFSHLSAEQLSLIHTEAVATDLLSAGSSCLPPHLQSRLLLLFEFEWTYCEWLWTKVWM